ncbi:histidine kinase N-terminal 7TM domain-containing protein [Indibacter alkaliphilus]|nr:histidine kinase N-terminal 7TM domain-containing protein [Indibacter alkaliphilus]
MNLEFTQNLLAIPVFITSLIFVILIGASYRKKNDLGEKYFSALLFFCFTYAFFYGFELLGADTYTITFFFKLEYLGGAYITPFLLTFVLKYSGNKKFITAPWMLLVFGISTFFLSMLYTNSIHGLFFRNIDSHHNGMYNAILYDRGIFDILYEVYNNILILISALILVKMYLTIPKSYRSQVAVLLAGVIFPWIAHSVALLGLNFHEIDLVPFTLLVSGALIYWSLFRHGLFKNNPVAFKTIFENLSDGIIILDKHQNVIAVNKKAESILSRTRMEFRNKKIIDFYDSRPELSALFHPISPKAEVEFFFKESSKTYSAFLINTDQKDLQYLFFREITKQKHAEEKIKANEIKLQSINTTLLRNEKMLTSIAFATKELLSNADFFKATQKAITILGDGASADRAYLFENKLDNEGNYYSSQRFEWSALGVESEINNPDLQDLPIGLFGESMDYLIKNQVYTNIVSNIEDPGLKGLLESQGIISILLIPIFVEKNFWGFVGFDDCQKEKVWSEGETALLISFAESISNAIERRNMEENLRQSMENAKDASIAKSEFLANMSHEIRTPLNGIIGFSDLLLKTSLNQTQKEFLKSIIDSGHLLLDLVNDVLDFSKIEAGKLELSLTEVNLAELAEESMNLVQPMAEEKHLILKISTPENLPEYLIADSTRLKQVLINLLSNAAKFTPKGEIELRIKLLENISDDKVLLNIAVRDTGIGISEEKKEIIFEAFAQEDNSTTREYGGTGLGLTISNKILELMNSKLELKTELGKGSTFSFTIALEIASALPKTKVKEEKKSNRPSETPIETIKSIKPKVLLVDDNPVNMLLAKTIVKNIIPNAEVFEAKNGQEAVDSFLKNNPKIIFMDIQMPIMSGYEATKEIRKLEKNDIKVPIIALTAGTVKGEYERCLEAGMDDYLSKPVVVADIQEKIQQYLPQKIKEEDKPIFSNLEEFRVSDPVFFKELLEVSSLNLSKLKNDLDQNTLDNDIKAIKQTCHAIKGVALNLNFKDLINDVTAAENFAEINETERERLLFSIHHQIDLILKNLQSEIEKA